MFPGAAEPLGDAGQQFTPPICPGRGLHDRRALQVIGAIPLGGLRGFRRVSF